MLAVLLTVLMFGQGLSLDDTGWVFVTAFPENIVHFHEKVLSYLKITSLFDNTTVTLTYNGNVDEAFNISRVLRKAGRTWTVNLKKEVEVSQFDMSNKSIVITGNQKITVLSVVGWPGSFQSHVVQPKANIGRLYHIPTLNYTKLVASFGLSLDLEPRYRSFRLLIISAVKRTNMVTIKQEDTQGREKVITRRFDNYSVLQLETNGEVTEINSTRHIAVLFTHPCFNSKGCSCNMVLNQLRPTDLLNKSSTFYVPFNSTYPLSPIKELFLSNNFQNVTVTNGIFQHGSDSVSVMNSTNILPLLPGFGKPTEVITTSKTVSLRIISPGLILDLIPESMFAACYLVHFNSLGSEALVIAETSSTASVRMNAHVLPTNTQKWTVVGGTQFSWTIVKSNDMNTSYTFWHPDSKIAVYVIEKLESDTVYGSAAVILSDQPDPKGCAVTQGRFVVGDEDLNWFWSRKYCQNSSDHFARPFRKQYQDLMVNYVEALQSVEGWISLRRDLITREWYWRSDDDFAPPVNFTYWEEGQPDVPEKGLCASVSLDQAKNFRWKSSRCFSKKKPICYKNPNYFNVV